MPTKITRSSSFKNQLTSHKSAHQIPQPFLQLNDANMIPMLGLGTWNANGRELKEAVKAAIYYGYRHIDTASNYKNESLVGEAINECIEEGRVRREDLFVTTKLWNNSHSRSAVGKALKRSLESLDLTYVDLYLVHYPIGYQEGDTLSPLDSLGHVITSDVDYIETWLGMEDAKYDGLARSVGVSNFNANQISRIISNCSIIPAINQVECHPYLSQTKLLKFCRSHGIELTGYSPLGSPGRMGQQTLDEPYLIEDPLVNWMAKKYQRPAAHILIRYQLERNIVVIPKSIQKTHIESNFDALSFKLSHDDMDKLSSLDRSHRYMKFERCLSHMYYPFDTEF